MNAADTATSNAQFLGYDVINRNLQERVFAAGSGLNFGKYIGSEALGIILGQYVGDGNELNFVNGNPNATNMTLWHVGMMALAKDVSLLPSGGGTLKEAMLRPAFLEALKAVSAWPDESARDEKTLLKFWLAVMSYDAPESEFIAWRDFFKSSELSGADRAAAVEGMMSTILLNPYFLLRK